MHPRTYFIEKLVVGPVSKTGETGGLRQEVYGFSKWEPSILSGVHKPQEPFQANLFQPHTMLFWGFVADVLNFRVTVNEPRWNCGTAMTKDRQPSRKSQRVTFRICGETVKQMF